jgi:hypothetical protein
LNTPTEQAKQHVEQAREKLAAVEEEADEVARLAADELIDASEGPVYAARWANTIAAAQAHATLAVAERLTSVVGHLEVLATPQRTVVGGADGITSMHGPSWPCDPGYAEVEARPLSHEWEWLDSDGVTWQAAPGDAVARSVARDQGAGRVRSRVVGPWTERPAR